MAHFDRLQIPNAQRASSSSSTISSDLSYGSEQHSKVSQLTDLTPLITPIDSVDSIFGDDPEIQPVPRFPDLVAWDGLTDEQWKLHSLVYKAERAIEVAEKGSLHEDFLREDIWYDDDLYGPEDDFDAVAAVRTRLVKGEQTNTTRRALKIIDGRSGIVPTLIEDNNSEHSIVVDVEEIEDYAEDFELGDDEVLDIPATPHTITHSRRSVLGAIEEVDEGREPDSLFNVTFPSPFLDIFVPPTPLIWPVDVVWDRPSLSTFDTSASTLMSPLVLNNPASTSTPAVFRNSFRKVDPRSPIVSISSFLFSSCVPLPTSLLDESLDIPAVVHPDVSPLGNFDLPQERGLGFVGVPTTIPQGTGSWTWADQKSSAVPLLSESPQYEFQKNHFDRPDGMKVVTPGVVGNIPESSSGVESPSNSGPLCDSSFEPARSPWDILVEGLVVPYIPSTLGSTIAYSDLATNIGFDGGNTVTAGSSHPAASASFTTSTNEDSKAGKKAKGLGLRLPMGLKQRVSRCSPGIPTSEACQDLANLLAASPEMETIGSLRGFQGHMLSPIAEEAPKLDPSTLETKPAPSPKKRRNFFKRILGFCSDLVRSLSKEH